jgi:hypothetical protein
VSVSFVLVVQLNVLLRLSFRLRGESVELNRIREHDKVL